MTVLVEGGGMCRHRSAPLVLLINRRGNAGRGFSRLRRPLKDPHELERLSVSVLSASGISCMEEEDDASIAGGGDEEEP